MGARHHNNHNGSANNHDGSANNHDGSANNHDNGGSRIDDDGGSANNHDYGGLTNNNGRFCGGADGASFGTSGPGDWFTHLHRLTTGSVREPCCGTVRNPPRFLLEKPPNSTNPPQWS